MAKLEISGLRKTFGPTEVIPGADLEIEDGEFVVFVGPSGCGKSTLLRMIAGLEEVTSGTIRIGDQDVTRVDPAHRGVAMVFQSYALFPHMSVAQNMGFGMRVNRVPRAEAEAKIRKAADILQLGPLLDRKPAQLSGGQRQRVAIGRAIVREPAVFLFDEPLSNLDAELRVQMRIELSALHQRLKSTMIYVTHDQVEAMTLANKIVVLRAGRIEQVGAPLDLYDDPDNLFVAGFIGSPRMNFFDATVAEGGGVVLAGETALHLPLEGVSLPAPGSEVVVGCRPEHFVVGAEMGLRMNVTAVEHLGTVSVAYAARPEGDPVAVELQDRRDVSPGDQLALGFPPQRTLVFDKATQSRLR
ncbi:sn-glycerol-3-phosphate ABC transporter ATP-binding protein UgpC [Loktanella sp. IMCC34160]|uniref:ABC transporter ATP-binding protein n=1 Tax=Loktanella sp. IMCC34160 TaxID=2510646 RepID=UPI00101CFADB|nr:sn-glycerol-3-phosphate ABC transporter ATP-binding protein UgpC [Loktanella sp. IMCC34160]RYG89151.1 sn-glycerol-3-phosphate ABC transporter ATP-binding protein UgpC [Loktanella sp. IMCC34160]